MPTDATLTRTEKNAIFLALQRTKFDPNEFEWEEVPRVELAPGYREDLQVSKLVHRVTGYYFVFGDLSSTFSPGTNSRVQNERHSRAERNSLFFVWLSRLRQEVDAPDWWASIGQEKVLSLTASSASLGNSVFSRAEQSVIATKLDEIKQYLIEGQQVDSQKAEFIEQQMAYLKEASTRMGRKDWLNILIGGLFGFALNLALPPETARGLFATAGIAFQSLWKVAQAHLH